MNNETLRTIWKDWRLLCAVVFAAILNFYDIAKEGYANLYYAAGVKSQMISWHNFFFNSFDPGGFITIDKPPLGFWIQTLSATIFGFHGWSILLPQALAGVISVILVYALVVNIFGRHAAALSAMIMAITPIAIAANRNNTIDCLLLLTLLLATWMVMKFIVNQRFGWLIGAAVLVGLGFNIKMMQAFMVLPAILLVYWLSSMSSWQKKLIQIIALSSIIGVVSLSWGVIVDLVPKSERPYIGSTKTNSVMELIFGYNGLSRWKGDVIPSMSQGSSEGMGAGMGQGMALSAGEFPDLNAGGVSGPVGGLPGGGLPDEMELTPEMQAQLAEMFGPGGAGGAMGNPMGGETGSKGALRLMSKSMFGQIGWLLPLALLSAFYLLWRTPWKDYYRDRKKQMVVFWLVWLVPMLVFFSYAGFFHRYYLIMMAPAIAILAGVGLTTLWANRKQSALHSWIFFLASMGTIVIQFIYLRHYYEDWKWLIFLIAGSVILFGIGIWMLKRSKDEHVVPVLRKTVFGLLLISVLAGPAVWSSTLLLYKGSETLPYAGPELNASSGLFSGMSEMNAVSDKLKKYLSAQYKEGGYLVATESAQSASTLILDTGLPVIAMGGFLGSDPAMSVEKLETLTKSGQLSYFLIGGMSFNKDPADNTSKVNEWIKQHCQEVPQEEWKDAASSKASNNTGFPMMGNNEKLYMFKS